MDSLKARLRRALPGPIIRAGSWLLDRSLADRRHRRRSAKAQAELRAEVQEAVAEFPRIVAELIAEHGGVVQEGPFRGLRLAAEAHRGGSLAIPPALLIGSYEEEIHGWVEELIAASPTRVINVGCAEGYYAVGFARRLPDTEVYAFDTDERGQELARETARINGVAERVHVAGHCSVTKLEELLVPGSLLVLDCEGCELELLCPEQAPSLNRSSVLVEFHDFVDPRISTEILARLRQTHTARVVGSRRRFPDRYAALASLSPTDRGLAIKELRPTEPHPMEWAVFVPSELAPASGRG